MADVFNIQGWLEKDFGGPFCTPIHFPHFSTLLWSPEGLNLRVTSPVFPCFLSSLCYQLLEALAGDPR